MKVLKNFLCEFGFLCIIIALIALVSIFSSQYTETTVTPGEVIYTDTHIGIGESFAFESTGTLVIASKIIDERGPHFSINTEYLAEDVCDLFTVSVLDASNKVLDTPKPYVSSSHTITYYTTYELIDAVYFLVECDGIKATCDAGTTLLLGLYL